MADPTQMNPSSASAAKSNARANAGDDSEPAAPPASPEQYSLGDHGEVRPGAGQTQPAPAAQASRQLAETGRRASHEAADFWRASIEPFSAVQMDMNRLFDELWRHTTGFTAFPALRAARPLAGGAMAPFFGQPATDVKETDRAYVLAVELPGLKREDIELQLRGETITISGQKLEERDEGAGAYRISERRYGRFERSFPIPPDVDRGALAAEFRDGVLKVTLPKSEEAAQTHQTIEVH